jgi:hypothetical protein
MRGLVRAYVETRRTGQAFGALPPFSAAERFFLSSAGRINLAANLDTAKERGFVRFFLATAQTWMEYLN